MVGALEAESWHHKHLRNSCVPREGVTGTPSLQPQHIQRGFSGSLGTEEASCSADSAVVARNFPRHFCDLGSW